MQVEGEAQAETQDEDDAKTEAETELDWLKRCSQHLSFLERRNMESQFLGHEVVRQMLELWGSFTPPPWGDWGYMLRKGIDWGVRALRCLVKLHRPSQNESMPEFMKRAMRFCEAVQRGVLREAPEVDQSQTP